jgi:hypothetical protein
MVREPEITQRAELDAKGAIDADLGLTLETVVVRNGAGSWVRDAAWDEYVVKIENRTGEALRVLDVSLPSAHLEAAPHSTTQLEALEKGTSAQVHFLQTAGVAVALGYGAGAIAFAGAAGAGSLGVIAAASAAVIMMPVAAIAGGVYMHKKHKQQKADRVSMQGEITRRSLPMPLELAPGAVREGSWFFPITPAPTRLEVRYEQGGAEHQSTLELPQLAELHIEAKVKAEPYKPAKRAPKHR